MPTVKHEIDPSLNNLAYSYLVHYDRLGGVIKDIFTQKEELIVEMTRRDAVKYNKPMLGSRMEHHIEELIAQVKKHESLAALAKRWLTFSETREEEERRAKDYEHAKEMLTLYNRLVPHYDWRWRSLDPVLEYSGALHAYVLGFASRPVYDPDYGRECIMRARWGYGYHHGYVIRIYCKELVPLFEKDPKSWLPYEADIDDEINDALADVEPQYHSGKEYY